MPRPLFCNFHLISLKSDAASLQIIKDMQSGKKTIEHFIEIPSRQPEQLRSVIDLSIPDDPLPLDQLLVDCRDTLKHQVKTGEAFIFIFNILLLDPSSSSTKE